MCLAASELGEPSVTRVSPFGELVWQHIDVVSLLAS